MAESNEKVLFYNYLNLFYKKLKNLEMYIKILEEVEYRLNRTQWNALEKHNAAKYLFKQYEKIFGRAPTESEFQRILDAKDTLHRFISSLRTFLQKIQAIQTKIYKWSSICKKIFQFIPTMEDIRIAIQDGKISKSDANEMISAATDAKDAMMRLIDNLTVLNLHRGIPLVGLIIDGYIQFFKAMNGVFDKIAQYARRILDELKHWDNDWNKIFRSRDAIDKEIRQKN